jgi:methionyl-tRNA formyltransferase
MKIVFMSSGAREKALRYLLQKNEEVVGVITPYPGQGNQRFAAVIATALEFGVPIFNVNRETLPQTLHRIGFDVLVSCGFGYIINAEAIKTAKYAINVHPTLLPKYRGFRSGPYVIMNGERKTGVTVHLLTEDVDNGPILAQQEIDISSFDTTKSIFRKCTEIEPMLLYSVIQDIKGGSLNPVPQDESKASRYGYIRTPDDSLVDWNKPLKDLYNEIRACDPADYPAFFYVDGQKVCIKLWRPKKPEEETDMI